MDRQAPSWASLGAISEQRRQLPALVRRPPLLAAPSQVGPGTWLLCENLQITGSYKIRAAFAVLQAYQRSGAAGPGVAVSSSGNFAIAFAFAGQALGVPISVVMMRKSSPFKASQAESYGARLVLCGDHLDDRLAALRQLRDEEGWFMVDHLEDPVVITGHATLGWDLCDACCEFSPAQVLVPVSTLGLAAGVALAVKQRHPDCRVLGLQAWGSDAAAQSFRAGRPVTRDRVETECDALTSNRPGALPLSLALNWLDDIVTVDEESIRQAVLALLEQAHLLVEPGGAIGYAALICGAVAQTPGTVVVLSGGNLDLTRLEAWRAAG